MPARLESAALDLPSALDWRRKARVARKIASLAILLALGAPLQWALLRLWPAGANALPMLFHRAACAVIGLRRDVRGASRGPALLVSNHMSWLDIVALSACRPTVFVGKSDIAGWAVFGTLARLQQTLFVARERRAGAAADAAEIARRVAAGQAVAPFAGGTTSDGCAVLPFGPALLAAAQGGAFAVQPVALAYLAREGAPLDPAGRREIAWWGDKELAPHLVEILALRRLDIRIEFGEAAFPRPGEDRKALARRLEADVRARVASALGA